MCACVCVSAWARTSTNDTWTLLLFCKVRVNPLLSNGGYRQAKNTPLYRQIRTYNTQNTHRAVKKERNSTRKHHQRAVLQTGGVFSRRRLCVFPLNYGFMAD